MKLISINIGKQETLIGPKRTEITGIFKRPVTGPVRIGHLGLEGDFIASQKHHGGPDQAVYIYGMADYEWWSRELGREIDPGTFESVGDLCAIYPQSDVISGDRLGKRHCFAPQYDVMHHDRQAHLGLHQSHFLANNL